MHLRDQQTLTTSAFSQPFVQQSNEGLLYLDRILTEVKGAIDWSVLSAEGFKL